MPVQAAIAINDGTAVAHTFNPDGSYKTLEGDKVTSKWVDSSPAIRVGYHSIQEQHAAANVNGLQKLRWVISRTTTETLSGAAAPSVAYVNTGVIEAWIHDRSSAAEAADMVAFIKNFTALAYFATKVNSRERTW